MNDGHVSDDRIQELLDARRTGASPFIPWHLKTCPRCRRRWEEYQQIYAGLDADPGFALPPAFAESVLYRIPARRSAWARPAVRLALWSAAAAAVLAAPALMTDMRPLLSGTANAFDSLLAAFRPLGGGVARLLSGAEAFSKLFLFGAVGFSSAAIVERFLQRQTLGRGH
jgi:hypothetical protein